MRTSPDTRSPRPGVCRTTRTTLSILAAGALLLGACADTADTADTADATRASTTTAAEDGEAAPTTAEPEQNSDEDPVVLDSPGEVAAGDTVETPNLGGLRFVAPEDRFIHQSPGFIVAGPPEPAEILLVRVAETLAGEPIDSVDAVIALIDEATMTLDELEPTTIAGLEARVFDLTAEPNPAPRPEDAIFRTVEDGVGGWGPAGEGRVWLLDTPRGIMLLTAGVLEPGAVDLADVIAEAETIFATLELVEVGS